MKNQPARALTTILFVGLLIAVVVLNRRTIAPPQQQPGSDALRQYGFRLESVAEAAGMRFVHQTPTFDAKLAHIMPQIASMGAAVSAVDYDRDGWTDLYVTNSGEGSKNCLFRNLRDGKFEDVAAKVGLADVNHKETGVSMGAVWGDYDGDGWEDLFLYKWGRPQLFRNDGGKGFRDVSDRAGLPKWVNANAATWLDYDRDGRLDLFVAGYYPENINLWRLTTTRIMPESFEYAENGGRKYLLRNRGDGAFEDVTAKMGIASHRWTLAVAAADLRGTGYPDLVLANDYGVTEVYANQNGRGFREIGKRVNIGYRPKSGMNVAFGDILNQSRFAIYITNISAEGNLIQGNNLWVPRAGTSGDALHYDNWAGDAGVELGGWSFGAQFGDLNNDGNLDLFLTNGYVSASKDKSYWYDFSKVAGGNKAIISDAANWPPMHDMSLSGYERKRVWVGDGFGKFVDVAQAVGYTDVSDGRSVAVADLWNRGALDVIVASQRGPLQVYKNTVAPENRWVQFALEGADGNRSAIGAQVQLFWKDANGRSLQQMQEVAAASGFCAQNQRRLHFGLGKDARVEKVVIRWPSGRVKTQTLLQPEPNKLHTIKEAA